MFCHLRRCTGGGVSATPLAVSKRSAVELRGNNQQIALAEFSRLVVLFLVPEIQKRGVHVRTCRRRYPAHAFCKMHS